MAPWQEQWSADLEKFYYNKDTKEVAWELPQYLKQLLDEHGFLLDDPAVPKTVSTIVRIPISEIISFFREIALYLTPGDSLSVQAPPQTPNPNPVNKQARARRVRKSASIQSLTNMKELAAAGYYDTPS